MYFLLHFLTFLGMGPSLETTLSAPAKAGRIDNLTSVENNCEKKDDLFEFSDPEIGEDMKGYVVNVKTDPNEEPFCECE